MSADTGQLPSTRALERAIKAVQEANKETATIRHVLILAVSLVAVGTLVAAGSAIAVSVAPEGRLSWVHHWKEFSHQVGISGVVLLGVYILAVLNRARHQAVLARLDRLEEEVCQPHTRSRRLRREGRAEELTDPDVVRLDDMRMLKRIDGKLREIRSPDES